MVRRLSHQNVPLSTRPRCTLHFLSSPFGRAVFPKKCLNFILRKSAFCHPSRFVADSSYGRPILLSITQRVTVTFHPLIPSAFSPLADPTLTSLQRDPLIWIKHQVRCVRSLSLPWDQSFSLPHRADSQDHLTDAYITFSGTRSSLRIQMSWLKHHLATTLGSISAWPNRLLPLIKTYAPIWTSIPMTSRHTSKMNTISELLPFVI